MAHSALTRQRNTESAALETDYLGLNVSPLLLKGDLGLFPVLTLPPSSYKAQYYHGQHGVVMGTK